MSKRVPPLVSLSPMAIGGRAAKSAAFPFVAALAPAPQGRPYLSTPLAQVGAVDTVPEIAPGGVGGIGCRGFIQRMLSAGSSSQSARGGASVAGQRGCEGNPFQTPIYIWSTTIRLPSLHSRSATFAAGVTLRALVSQPKRTSWTAVA
jgi:hypothetical protein